MSAARVVPVAPLSLSALLSPLVRAVRAESRLCWVVAEVDHIVLRGPHWYLTLSERREGQIEPVARCTAMVWASNAGILDRFAREAGMPVAPGMRVLIQAEPALHIAFGLSLRVEAIDAAFTLGEAARGLRQIRERLHAEGIFARNRSLPPPTDYARVAVLSPADAAGLADFRRHADQLSAAGLCAFRYATARFQGAEAEREMLAALREIWREHHQAPYDAVVVIRGGGAATDLSWLSRYSLARAICLMPAPVITGIGHATDRTMLDEVAFLSLDTPSRVSAHLQDTIAARAAEAARDLREITRHARRQIERAGGQIERDVHAVRLCARSRLREATQGLSRERERLQSGAEAVVRRARQEIEGHARATVSLGPRQTLARGYAIVRTAEGRPITRAAQLPRRGRVTLEFADATHAATTGAEHDPA